MTLPSFWRQPSFSVAETAELVGVSEVTLRTWLTRAPPGDFLGTKTANRIFFSGREVFYYLLVAQLSAYGVPIRTALYAAAKHATDNLPLDQWLIVRTSRDVTDFELAEDIPATAAPALVLPLRALAIGLIERAAVVYATEGS
ncbi:hypothetical protein HJB77_27280 [Rhizobium lentis]|uniref:helix-turn-helix domain-containing protein n=1 Tax=Rhizobium lentis TaxID=1138194 RepID=UPI001C83C6DB|nr:helix-turn-helix domain-containing protein [Rhizobium lentis]MBX5179926.1 hypothetical protein [Rhizobium lentis]